MMILHPVPRHSGVEIVGRKTNENEGDGNEGADKSNKGRDSQAHQHFDWNDRLQLLEKTVHHGAGILTCDLEALKPTIVRQPRFTARFPTGYNPSSMSIYPPVNRLVSTVLGIALLATIPAHAGPDELAIAITKKGLGKEVLITQGTKEWYMLVEVTPENTVVVRQEKEGETYLVDESETHDRPLLPGEVDQAITDYVNSVKTRAQKK